MTIEEKIDSLERKIDLLLGTLGIRETMRTESKQKIAQMSRMSLEDLKANSKLISLKLRRTK